MRPYLLSIVAACALSALSIEPVRALEDAGSQASVATHAPALSMAAPGAGAVWADFRVPDDAARDVTIAGVRFEAKIRLARRREAMGLAGFRGSCVDIHGPPVGLAVTHLP
jgi:hypothetical protein